MTFVFLDLDYLTQDGLFSSHPFCLQISWCCCFKQLGHTALCNYITFSLSFSPGTFSLFCRAHNSQSRCISDSLACSWDPFPPFGSPCPRDLPFLYCILLCSICFLSLGLLFWREMEEAWIWVIRRKCGGTRRSESIRTVVGTYHMREESIFKKK